MVQKEVQPVERVRLAKEAIRGEEPVSDEIRKEVVETEGDDPGRANPERHHLTRGHGGPAGRRDRIFGLPGGNVMSRHQFAFLIAVLLVWLAWQAGWVVLAAVAAGLIGVAVVRVLEGSLDLNELTERFRSSSGPSNRP